ncbi:hypothetical protein E1J61_12470 [Cupriavidus sp. L7L]|nr:hypothetical protein E1J61_12470 [Cupriavidus sp. L7L]
MWRACCVQMREWKMGHRPDPDHRIGALVSEAHVGPFGHDFPERGRSHRAGPIWIDVSDQSGHS